MKIKIRQIPLGSAFTGSIGVWTGLFAVGAGNHVFAIRARGLEQAGFGAMMGVLPDTIVDDYVGPLDLAIYVRGRSVGKRTQVKEILCERREPKEPALDRDARWIELR